MSAVKLIGWLVRKDLRVFFADRNGALMAFVLPVLLASLISMLFAGRSRTGTVELLVVDQDQGPATRALVAALDSEASLVVIEVPLDEARRRIERGQAGVALVLPVGTSQALRPSRLFVGEPVAVTLLNDPSRDIEAELVAGLFQRTEIQESARGLGTTSGRLALLEDLSPSANGAWTAVLAAATALAKSDDATGKATGTPAQGAPAKGGMQLPLTLVPTPVVAAGSDAGYNSYAHNFAGMLCMFMLFLAQDLARTLLQERASGVLVRTRLAASRPLVPLIAIASSTTLLGLTLTGVVFGVGIAIFGIELRGGIVAFVTMALAISIFAGGFAVLLAGLARSEKQVSAIGTAVVLLSSFIGGAWYPRFMMPEWLQRVSSAVPTSWATDGLAAATWRGLPLTSALLPAGLLALTGALFIAIGKWRFRWE